jgi:hypothetical protein
MARSPSLRSEDARPWFTAAAAGQWCRSPSGYGRKVSAVQSSYAGNVQARPQPFPLSAGRATKVPRSCSTISHPSPASSSLARWIARLRFGEVFGAPMLGTTSDDVSWLISAALFNCRCSRPR